MVMNPGTPMQKTNLIVLIIALALLVVVQGALMYLLLDAAREADGDAQKSLLWFARLAMIGLFLSVLIGAALVLRLIRGGLFRPTDEFKPMGYVDVWSEAGRRIDAEDAPPVEGFEEEDQGGDEGKDPTS